jgi:hypothetical protein
MQKKKATREVSQAAFHFSSRYTLLRFGQANGFFFAALCG